MRNLSFLALGFLVATAQTTTAASVTVTYDFSVGGFTVVGAPPAANAPVTQINGSFTTTFETISGNGFNPSTLDAISLSINGFNYTLSNTHLIVRSAKVDADLFSGRFEIGGEENGGAYGGGDYSDDFHLFFTDSGKPTGYSNELFRYTVVSSPGFFDATTLDITRSSVSIPEPSSLMLILTVSATLVGCRQTYLSTS